MSLFMLFSQMHTLLNLDPGESLYPPFQIEYCKNAKYFLTTATYRLTW
jgi:hypothetical protein